MVMDVATSSFARMSPSRLTLLGKSSMIRASAQPGGKDCFARMASFTDIRSG